MRAYSTRLGILLSVFAISACGRFEASNLSNVTNSTPPKPERPVFHLDEQTLREGPGPYYHIGMTDYLTRTLHNSPILDEFRSRVAEATHEIDIAYVPYRPHANFIATYTHYGPSDATLAGGFWRASDEFDLRLEIEQVITDFGRMKWAVLAAQLSEKAAIEEYRRAVNKVIEDATIAYIEACRANEVLDVQNTLVVQRQEHLKMSEALFEAGAIGNLDVARSRAELGRSQNTLLEMQRKANTANGEIFLWLREPSSRKPLLLDMPTMYAPPASVEEGERQALYRRPEVSGLQWAIQAGDAYVEYAARGMNPVVTVGASVRQGTPTTFEPGFQWTIGFQIVIPLADGGQTEAETNIAKEKVKQLSAQLAQVELLVRHDVQNFHADLLNAYGRLDLANEEEKDALEFLRLAQVRFKAGDGTTEEVLAAQNTLAQARFNRIHSQYDYLEAQTQWNWAVSADFPVAVPGPRDTVPANTVNLPPERPAPQQPKT